MTLRTRIAAISVTKHPARKVRPCVSLSATGPGKPGVQIYVHVLVTDLEI